MDDLISRQAALEAVTKYCLKYDLRELLADIECLPTAEKRGEWIPVVDGNYIIWECSECHVESEAWTDYCPICGSRNIEEMDEGAYEEVLEEFKKNPKTLDEVEAELGLTADPSAEEAFEAGYTKAQMELKDAYKPKKGKWIDGNKGKWNSVYCPKCSVCGTPFYGIETARYHYCPNCGAKMEE